MSDFIAYAIFMKAGATGCQTGTPMAMKTMDISGRLLMGGQVTTGT